MDLPSTPTPPAPIQAGCFFPGSNNKLGFSKLGTPYDQGPLTALLPGVPWPPVRHVGA